MRDHSGVQHTRGEPRSGDPDLIHPVGRRDGWVEMPGYLPSCCVCGECGECGETGETGETGGDGEGNGAVCVLS